jgi:hypothetical protein
MSKVSPFEAQRNAYAELNINVPLHLKPQLPVLIVSEVLFILILPYFIHTVIATLKQCYETIGSFNKPQIHDGRGKERP